MVKYMKLIYRGKEISLIECKSFFERFRGFMMQKNIDHCLLFDRCNSIHTFFMREAIDVIYCNSENVILYYYQNVKPNHIILPKRGVSKVYELPVGFFDIHLGDTLEVKE